MHQPELNYFEHRERAIQLFPFMLVLGMIEITEGSRGFLSDEALYAGIEFARLVRDVANPFCQK